MLQNIKCFVILPFLPELNFFYLFIKHYLYEKHNIECQRADHQILTIPLLEKIKNQIQNANVIIADISNRNPNVFYELGIAHTYGKNVILITSDQIKETPSDIRHFEFIKYDLNQHTDFLSKLDNAFNNLLIEKYNSLYKSALSILKLFNKELNCSYQQVSMSVFQQLIVKAEKTQSIPSLKDKRTKTEFLLPKIISDSTNIETMRKITDWLGTLKT